MNYKTKVYGDWVFIFEGSEIKVRINFAYYPTDQEALEKLT